MRLLFEQVVPLPLERVFAFYEDPECLVRLSGSLPGFRLVSHDGGVREGCVTRVSVLLGPFRIPMTFVHGPFVPLRSFQERQGRGPFREFHHVHEFERHPEGTLVRDALTVRLPWWLGGELATRWFAAPRLRKYFGLRNAEIVRLAGSGEMRRRH